MAVNLRIKFLLAGLLVTASSSAGNFTVTTQPAANVLVVNQSGIPLFRGHLTSIKYNTVNGVQVVTVTVMP